jgi:hypothetical protein
MPINPNPPAFTDVFSRANRDAQVLVSEAIYRASGGNFLDLAKPPSVTFVVRAYIDVMGTHIAEALLERSAAFAERDANRKGQHAAEILSPDGERVGFTLYSDCGF